MVELILGIKVQFFEIDLLWTREGLTVEIDLL